MGKYLTAEKKKYPGVFLFLGPLLPERLDVTRVPQSQLRELTINLCGTCWLLVLCHTCNIIIHQIVKVPITPKYFFRLSKTPVPNALRLFKQNLDFL